MEYNAHIIHYDTYKHTQVPKREDLNEEFDLSVDVTVHVHTIYSLVFSEFLKGSHIIIHTYTNYSTLYMTVQSQHTHSK